MRLIKAGLIGLVVLSLLVFLLSLLFPSNVRVSRAIDIYTSREEVSRLVMDPAGWKHWYLPLKTNADTAWATTGNGFSSKTASLSIQSTSDSSVAVTARNKDEVFNSNLQIIGDGANGHCTVQWYADMPVKWYPWEKFGSIFFDKILGPGIEQSLQELKKQAEKQGI